MLSCKLTIGACSLELDRCAELHHFVDYYIDFSLTAKNLLMGSTACHMVFTPSVFNHFSDAFKDLSSVDAKFFLENPTRSDV